MPLKIQSATTFWLTVTIWFAGFSTMVGQEDSRKLRWNLKAGEKLEAVLTQDTNVSSSLNNRDQEIGNKMLLEMDWNIKTATANEFTIEQSIRRIKLTINAPGKGGVKITTVDTDSDQEPGQLAGQLLQQIRPLIGTTFMVFINARGEIVDVKIPDASMEVIRQAPASMQIRNVLTKEGLKELFGQSAIAFPENAVASGDSWTAESELKNELGDLQRTSEFTYVGSQEEAENKFDKIKVITEAKLTNTKSETILDNFSGTGDILFAADSTRVLESRWKNSLTTSRNYRDKIIRSTVETTATLTVNRK